MSTKYEASHCATSSILLLLHHSLVQIFFLRTLFSNTFSPRFSLNVTDQVSHPYKTTDRIVVLYILTFTFLDISYKEETIRFNIICRMSSLFAIKEIKFSPCGILIVISGYYFSGTFQIVWWELIRLITANIVPVC
jgi:hypothetical protein